MTSPTLKALTAYQARPHRRDKKKSATRKKKSVSVARKREAGDSKATGVRGKKRGQFRGR